MYGSTVSVYNILPFYAWDTAAQVFDAIYMDSLLNTEIIYITENTVWYKGFILEDIVQKYSWVVAN